MEVGKHCWIDNAQAPATDSHQGKPELPTEASVGTDYQKVK
jgi:hypothetical protein